MPRTYTNPTTGNKVQVWKARDWSPEHEGYVARTSLDPGTVEIPSRTVEYYEQKVELGEWEAEGSLDDRLEDG